MPNVIVSPTGVQGPRGNAVLHGTGAPGATVGIDGDYYIDTTSYPTSATLYGPKASGAWPGSGVTFGGGAMGALLAANNLSDVQSAATSRTNLGLGTAAVQNTSAFDASGAAATALAAAISDAAGKYQTLQPWLFDVTKYGAPADAKVVVDGVMNSGSAILTSASGQFEADIVNKTIIVNLAGPLGVTSLVTTVQSRQSATQITLAAANASGGNVTAAKVVWGTDLGTGMQAATDAATAYLSAGNPLAVVWIPPGAYMNASPLNSTQSGNGQMAFGPVSTSGQKKTLMFLGPTDGAAAVRHWLQGVPQFTGACIISAGVYASTAAQIADINAHGNPAVICGPNESAGYGVNANFSNMQVVVKNLAILTTHSAYGLTYGALNLWGVANAYVENVGYGTLGTVASPSTDYSSPGVFGTGLSVGMLLPAPGNNDHVVARNISCGGGYTYGIFATEHTVADRYMALYCWSGIVAVGTYAGSVGSVHAIKVLSASVEACTHELYIYGPGSQGVGPRIDIDQLSTESSSPNITGSTTGAMNAALGLIRLTGLFTESNVSTSAPTGIELVDGQVPRPIKRRTGAFTCSPIDRVLICDTSTAGFTATLPDASFCAAEYVFKTVGANDLTVATTASQSIYTSSGTGTTTVTVPTGQVLRVQALYNGTAWGWYALAQNYLQLSGGTLTGDLLLQGTGKAYRLRRSGSNLDFEGTGTDLIVSNWSGPNFDGSQRSYFRLSADAQNAQVAGKVEFVDALYGAAKHVLDGAGNQVAFFGAAPTGRPTVTGSKGGNAALGSLITALATLGLITDNTT